MESLGEAIYRNLPTNEQYALSVASLSERLNQHEALQKCDCDKHKAQKIRRQLAKLEADKPGKIHAQQYGKEWRFWKSCEPETQLSYLLQQLSVLQDVIQQRLPSGLQRQLNDVMQQLPVNKGNWLRKIYIAPSSVWQPPKLNPEVVTVVYQAIEEDRTFSCDYTTLKGITRRVTLVPWGLMTKAEKVYVLAIERGSKKTAPVTYAMLSIRNAELGEHISLLEGLPVDVDLRTYCETHQIGSFGADSPVIDLVVRFYGNAGRRLEETPLSDNMQLHELSNNCREIHATVRNTVELRKFLRGFGEQVEVIAPDLLRSEMIQELHACLNRYQQ
ncbi:helix-turn-helix transcriptional regulator [Shewanella cyperi]|uniref:helix-turn-helix transcriptional regulator n=1 Tax=Shewanella cyperi TaxID=2814292 RepID=UPI001A95029E|nr:WYL domain-containing protein [Shewanella cyperi]QSX39787.1 WYL domain-containing protein [Shewanella cyperi]